MSNELVSWKGATLNVEAMRSFQRASLALGAPIQVTDSYRSHAQQAAAYARKPGLAAPPGSSYHERGLAIDVDGDAYGGYGSEAFRRVAETLEALGWHRFDPAREPWHFSYRVTG
jgi:D-alanyl-D-alanine dipeptidase